MRQGQRFLERAAVFALPEKLDDKTTFTPMDRALAAGDVRELYRELISRSPRYAADRILLFGPADGWEKKPVREGEAWAMLDQNAEVEIALGEDALSGLYHLLLVAAHPISESAMNVQDQEEVLWPVAQKARLVKALRKALGIEGIAHKRLDLDEEAKEQKTT